jgi:rfaE bifunctional protein kinase chain/domain
VNAAAILDAIRRMRVLVAGDVCLDRWCTYDPELAEPSRETTIPRTAVVSTQLTPGAAGTVANNLAALGAQVSVLGAIGEDGFGFELRHALAERGISSDLLLSTADFSTFTYTKLLNAATGEEDLPRVDFVNTRPLPPNLDSRLNDLLHEAAKEFDVIIVSDQAETRQGGVVTPAMRDTLTRIATERNDIVIWVDSRMRPEHFRGVIVKPNQQEADAACLRTLGRVDYPAFRARIAAPLLVVTCGANGAMVVDAAGEHRVATKKVEHPVDICGAGDSFSAGAALALKATGDPLAAVQFGNCVASITIMKKGTGTASPEEVLAREV